MKYFTISKPFLDSHCALAEGPFWERETNTLRFVDIVKQRIWWVDLAVGPDSAKSIQYSVPIGVTAELDGPPNSFIFAGKHGIGIGQRYTPQWKYIRRFWTESEVERESRMRANDGAVDSAGRFWVGIVNDPLVAKPGPDGMLVRLDTDGRLHRMIERVVTPNGISSSLDNKSMFFTDSGANTIFSYSFDEATGSLSNKQVFFSVSGDSETPDGHVQDTEGNLWVAIWGAWKVVRVSPEGKVTAEISLPTRCPTAVALADGYIYITSEADPDVERHPLSKQYAGAVFRCHVGVNGRRPFIAKMTDFARE